MGRPSKGKPRKSETNSESEEEINNSLKQENNETSNSTVKRVSSRSRVKTNDENPENKNENLSNGKQNEERQENGNSSSKKRRKDSNESLTRNSESDEEAVQSPTKKRRSKHDKANYQSQEEKATRNKKRGKVEKEEESEQDGEEYEVEKIVDQRTIKGRRQFLVRWKGYTAESDSWEQEKELNCDRLIEEFMTEQEENNESFEDKEKTEKKSKSKKAVKNSKNVKATKKTKNNIKKSEDEDNDEDDDADTSKEYEVDRIIEVHFRKDKKREFLIRWKGFSKNEDTWEPEEHLNCPTLINNFMEKLDKIKTTDSRELRTDRTHTNRLTLTLTKRQSRRNASKQRISYHETE